MQQIVKLASTQQDPRAELCGVILPTPFHGVQVMNIPNRAEDPHTSFRMIGADLRFQLAGWFEEADPSLWPEVIFWHTHPGGGIGPSRVDMQNKPPSGYSLVIALTPDGPVPTFY